MYIQRQDAFGMLASCLKSGAPSKVKDVGLFSSLRCVSFVRHASMQAGIARGLRAARSRRDDTERGNRARRVDHRTSRVPRASVERRSGAPDRKPFGEPNGSFEVRERSSKGRSTYLTSSGQGFGEQTNSRHADQGRGRGRNVARRGNREKDAIPRRVDTRQTQTSMRYNDRRDDTVRRHDAVSRGRGSIMPQARSRHPTTRSDAPDRWDGATARQRGPTASQSRFGASAVGMDGTDKERDAKTRQVEQRETNMSRSRTRHLAERDESAARRNEARIPMSIKYTTSASTFVPGNRAVMAALQGGRRREFHKAYIADHGPAKSAILRQLKELNVPTTKIDDVEMTKMLQALGMPYAVSDGVLLECSAIPQLPVQFLKQVITQQRRFEVEVMPQSKEDERINGTDPHVDMPRHARSCPLILWLHGVVDTGNIAGLYRSALYYGADAVALSTRATGGVPRNKNMSNVRAAAGAAEYVPTLSVPDAEMFIHKSQQHGWKFISTSTPDTSAKLTDILGYRSTLHTNPCVLILGNEDEGLPRRLQRQTDARVAIDSISSMARRADVDSLNVGVAGGVLLDRLLGRQHLTQSPTDPSQDKKDVTSTEDATPSLW